MKLVKFIGDGGASERIHFWINPKAVTAVVPKDDGDNQTLIRVDGVYVGTVEFTADVVKKLNAALEDDGLHPLLR